MAYLHNDIEESAQQVFDRRKGSVEISEQEFVSMVGVKVWADFMRVYSSGVDNGYFRNGSVCWTSIGNIDRMFEALNLYRFVVNKFGVVFEFDEDYIIPKSSSGFAVSEKGFLKSQLAKNWDIDQENDSIIFYHINVNKKTMTCDRGFSVPIESSIMDFVEQYEV